MDRLTDIEKSQYINILFEEKSIKENIERLSIINSKIPQKFYRYRNLSNDFEIDNIMQGQIWLSKPTEFNDPYDSKINIDVDEMLSIYFATEKRTTFGHEKLDRMKRRSIECYIKREKRKLQKYTSRKLEWLRKSFGIACFSEVYDSLLMWSHYADYHRGICLEYSFEEIKKLVSFCPIIYTDQFENFLNYIDIRKEEVSSEVMKLFLSKSKDWSYENEWRIVDTLSESSEAKGKLLKGLKPLNILMGCQIDGDNERKIIKVANKLHIPVAKMKMDTKRFRVYIDDK